MKFSRYLLAAFAAIVALGAPTWASAEDETSQPKPWVTTKSIDYASALAISRVGLQAAREMGLRASIAVVNASGQTIVLLRDDGASQQFSEGATAKAWTAANLSASTQELDKQSRIAAQDNAQLPNIAGTLYLWGGLPLEVDGALVGAVGAAAGTGEQDVRVAEAAASAYEKRVSESQAP